MAKVAGRPRSRRKAACSRVPTDMMILSAWLALEMACIEALLVMEYRVEVLDNGLSYAHLANYDIQFNHNRALQ